MKASVNGALCDSKAIVSYYSVLTLLPIAMLKARTAANTSSIRGVSYICLISSLVQFVRGAWALIASWNTERRGIEAVSASLKEGHVGAADTTP